MLVYYAGMTFVLENVQKVVDMRLQRNVNGTGIGISGSIVVGLQGRSPPKARVVVMARHGYHGLVVRCVGKYPGILVATLVPSFGALT